MSWSEEENPRGGEKGDIMDSKEKRNVSFEDRFGFYILLSHPMAELFPLLNTGCPNSGGSSNIFHPAERDKESVCTSLDSHLHRC